MAKVRNVEMVVSERVAFTLEVQKATLGKELDNINSHIGDFEKKKETIEEAIEALEVKKESLEIAIEAISEAIAQLNYIGDK